MPVRRVVVAPAIWTLHAGRICYVSDDDLQTVVVGQRMAANQLEMEAAYLDMLIYGRSVTSADADGLVRREDPWFELKRGTR